MSIFVLRRRKKNRSLAFNSAMPKLESFNSVFSATYVPPLPPAGGTTPLLGTTGDWKFEEFLEMNGPSLLQLMYKDQQIHAFLP